MSDPLTVAAREAKLKFADPQDGTTAIMPDECQRNRIVGRGDVLNNFRQVSVTGETSSQGDSARPDMMAPSSRRFGTGQPGSERLNFLP